MSDERSTTTIDRKLGQRVRTRRLEIGMSQERLAELLGVTFQQVQKYEKGVNRIAASRLLGISVALDKPIGDFFEGMAGAVVCDDGRANQIADAMATPEGVRLASTFARIKNRKTRQRIVDLAAAVAEDAP